MNIKKADLHVHVQQSMHIEDLFTLAKDRYRDINWNRFGFLDRYEAVFGYRPHPISIFERALETGSLEEIAGIGCYDYRPMGTFDAFNIKSHFCIVVQGYYFDRDRVEPVLELIVERHRQEGLNYVEYRHGFGGSGAEWQKWHARFARFFKEASDPSFTAKYIVRLGSYEDFKGMLEENEDLYDTVVGVDFSGAEIAPESLEDFYQQVAEDRDREPCKTADVVVHIGENFYDKSLESAIRWCHQHAQFGAKRLAHCIALGLDPIVAIKRKEDAHTHEPVSERISQIQYDITNADQLAGYGITLDLAALKKELNYLKNQRPDKPVYRAYDDQRLESIVKRQDYVLDALKKMKVAIETCPTSNLCIGGIPSKQHHPFKKLYASKVDLAICSDDPGVFRTTLSKEVDFVIHRFGIDPEELCSRLGDPYTFRLKANQ